jgi:hypothetical protein
MKKMIFGADSQFISDFSVCTFCGLIRYLCSLKKRTATSSIMKKIICSVALIISALSVISCNDKLDIAAPHKDITVVYGMLDIADTAHYIRIQKAFMDENQSAIDMAKVADSNFYKSLEVTMKELNAAGVVRSIITLSKVDLEKEGFAKDTGAFFNTPNFAYKFKYPLTAGNRYRIVIRNTNTGNIDSAETDILDNSGAYTVFGLTEWVFSGAQISFSQIMSDAGKLRQSEYTAHVPANTGDAQLLLRFNWIDSNIASGTAVRRSADFSGFTFKSSVPNPLAANFGLVATNKDIFDFLKATMGTPGTNQYRYMDSCDMLLYVAGVEYRRFKDLNSFKGGLTADEIKPLYTNIKGKDVMGLLSTRTYAVRYQMTFGTETKDSLSNGSITRDLNIRFK